MGAALARLADASSLFPGAAEPPAGCSGCLPEGKERTVRAARSPPDLPMPPGGPVTTAEGWGSGPLIPRDEPGQKVAKRPEPQTGKQSKFQRSDSREVRSNVFILQVSVETVQEQILFPEETPSQ